MFINENRNTIISSFQLLLNDNTMKDKFEKNYLPLIETLENDSYILTNRYIYSNVGAVHHKYLHFNKDGILLTDPKYNYVKIDYDGYLMKLILNYPINGEYVLGYFIKLDEIKLNKSNYMDKGIMKNNLIFDSCDYTDIISEPLKSIIMKPKEFFNKYLSFNLNQF